METKTKLNTRFSGHGVNSDAADIRIRELIYTMKGITAGNADDNMTSVALSYTIVTLS